MINMLICTYFLSQNNKSSFLLRANNTHTCDLLWFFDLDHLSLCWICYNIASVLRFGFWPQNMFSGQGSSPHTLHWRAQSFPPATRECLICDTFSAPKRVSSVSVHKYFIVASFTCLPFTQKAITRRTMVSKTTSFWKESSCLEKRLVPGLGWKMCGLHEARARRLARPRVRVVSKGPGAHWRGSPRPKMGLFEPRHR